MQMNEDLFSYTHINSALAEDLGWMDHPSDNCILYYISP